MSVYRLKKESYIHHSFIIKEQKNKQNRVSKKRNDWEL